MVDFLRSSCSGFLSCDFTAVTRLFMGRSSSSETLLCPLKMSLCLNLLLTPWVTLLLPPLLPWTTFFVNRVLTQCNIFRKVSYINFNGHTGQRTWELPNTAHLRCLPAHHPVLISTFNIYVYLRLSALWNPSTCPHIHTPTSFISLTSLHTPARHFPSHLGPSNPESHCSFGPPPPSWALEGCKDPKAKS